MTTPLTPKFLDEQLHDLQNYINILKEKSAEAKRKHKPLNRGTNTYDDIQYWTFMIMCHTDIIRKHLVQTELLKPCTLANGTVMTNNGIKVS